ncbi:MAG: hypothetical protein HZC41_13820 [Chloroflexi bacterium]|nr:hypothetical protein [Chloroflexota bacterium]
MKQQLISIAAWINADPRRFRFLMLSVTSALTLLAVAAPDAVTVAGWAAGGSD